VGATVGGVTDRHHAPRFRALHGKCMRIEFGAYCFLTETVATHQYWDGGVIEGVFTPEYRAYVVASLILKLFSAGDTFVSLRSTE
jgi:hypothetical protein